MAYKPYTSLSSAEAAEVRAGIGVFADVQGVRVTRIGIVVSGATAYLGDDPNGTYEWTPASNAFVNGDFKIFKNSVNSEPDGQVTTWYLYLSGSQIASRIDSELPGPFVVSDANFVTGPATTILASTGTRSLFFSGVASDVTDIINECAYGDEITFGSGEYTYGGLPYAADFSSVAPGNNLGSAGADAIGNHLSLPGGLLLQGEGYRTATIKFVQGSAEAHDHSMRYGLLFQVFRCGGTTRMIDLVVDANAKENITVNGVLKLGTGVETPWDWDYVDNDGNYNLNPHYGCHSIVGRDSVLRGCRFIGWTGGGCNLDLVTYTSEQFANAIVGVNCVIDDCVYEEPVDVAQETPYVSVFNSRYGAVVRNCSVNLPDTPDDYWTLGGGALSAAGTFAFANHDNTVFENNKARNCGAMFHRDTLALNGSVMRGNSCVNCVYGVLFQITDDLCQNVVIADNTFEVRNGNGSTLGRGVFMTVADILTVGGGRMRGITINNNTVIGAAGTEYGFFLNQEVGDIEDVTLRHNRAGVWSTAYLSTRQIEGSLLNTAEGVEIDPWQYESDAVPVSSGGTGAATTSSARTSLGLEYLVVPNTEPPVYGAVWNNAGTLAISSADTDTDSFVALVNAEISPALVPSATVAAIDVFIRGEKTAGRWAKHELIYLPIWGDAAANAICMKTLSSGTWVGTVTHGTGYAVGNGTTGCFNTGHLGNSLNLTNASGFLWALPLTVHSTTSGAFGGFGQTNSSIFLRSTGFNNLQGSYCDNTSPDPIYVSNAAIQPLGVLSMSRLGSALTLCKRTVTGTQILDTDTAAPTGAPSASNVFFMARNNSVSGTDAPANFDNSQLGGFGVSTGLTQEENDAFTLAIRTLWENATALEAP